MTKRIKLMTDYGCFPLWWIDSTKVGNIDPETLPLHPATISSLKQWAATYDSILNADDPASSGFSNLEDEEAFEKEGIKLWKKLQQELFPEYQVSYFSQLQRRVL